MSAAFAPVTESPPVIVKLAAAIALVEVTVCPVAIVTVSPAAGIPLVPVQVPVQVDPVVHAVEPVDVQLPAKTFSECMKKIIRKTKKIRGNFMDLLNKFFINYYIIVYYNNIVLYRYT